VSVYPRAMNEYRIYDTVLAETLGDEPNEQVSLTNEEGGTDYLILFKVIKENDAVSITGESQITGDMAWYILPWDTKVDLWMVAD
jgi:hypothetical protein